MAKSQLNARVSDLTRRQLEELSERWGTSLTETLTVIIDRTYRLEILEPRLLINQEWAKEKPSDKAIPRL
jgi:hypothetical protein